MREATERYEGGATGNEGQVSRFKTMRAAVCEHCPICNHDWKTPDSTIGTILHHRFHADHCPMWTAYRGVHGETGDRRMPGM